MGNFQGRDNRGGGGFRGGNGGGGNRPSFGGNRGGDRGGDRGPVTMHKAVCDECHKDCEVPFRPSSDKPIFCNECFGGKRDGDRAPRRDFNDRAPRRDFNNKVNSPVSKPIQSSDDSKNLLKEINVKLDRLTSAIEKLSMPKTGAVVLAKLAPVAIKKVEVKNETPKAVFKKVTVKVAPKKLELKKLAVKPAVKKIIAVKEVSKKIVSKKKK